MKPWIIVGIILLMIVSSASAGSLNWNNVSNGNSVEVPLSTVEPDSLTATVDGITPLGTWCAPIVGCLFGRGDYSIRLKLESEAGFNTSPCIVSNASPSTNCSIPTKLGEQEFQVVLAQGSTQQSIQLSVNPRNFALFKQSYAVDAKENPSCVLEDSGSCQATAEAAPETAAPAERPQRALPKEPVALPPQEFRTPSGEKKSFASLQWDIPLDQEKTYSITLPAVDGKRLMVFADEALSCAKSFTSSACNAEPEKRVWAELSFQWAGEGDLSHCHIALTGVGDGDSATCQPFIQLAQIESHYPQTRQVRVKIDSEFIPSALYVNAAQHPECNLETTECKSMASTEPALAPSREEPDSTPQQQPEDYKEPGTLVWRNVSPESIGQPVDGGTEKGASWEFTLNELSHCKEWLCMLHAFQNGPVVRVTLAVDGKVQDCDSGIFSGTDQLRAVGLNQPVTCSGAETEEAKDTTLTVTRYDPSNSSADLMITGSIINGNHLFDEETETWCELDIATKDCKEGTGDEPTPTQQQPGQTPETPVVSPENVSFNTGYSAIDAESERLYDQYVNTNNCTIMLSRAAHLELGDDSTIQTNSGTRKLDTAKKVWNSFQPALQEGDWVGYYFNNYPMDTQPYHWIDESFVRGLIAQESSWKAFQSAKAQGVEDSLGLMQVNVRLEGAKRFDPVRSGFPYFKHAGITSPVTGDNRFNPQHNIGVGEDILAKALESAQRCVSSKAGGNESEKARALAAYAYKRGSVPSNCSIPEPNAPNQSPNVGNAIASVMAWDKVFETYYPTVKSRIASNPKAVDAGKSCVALFGGTPTPSPTASIETPPTSTAGKPSEIRIKDYEVGKNLELTIAPQITNDVIRGTRVTVSKIPEIGVPESVQEKEEVFSVRVDPNTTIDNLRLYPFQVKLDPFTLNPTISEAPEESCPGTSCTPTNYGGCAGKESCDRVGGTWCTPTNTLPFCEDPSKPCDARTTPVCSLSEPENCGTENDCRNAGAKWCMPSAGRPFCAVPSSNCFPVLVCSIFNPENCVSEPSCKDNLGNWCTTESGAYCQKEPCPPPETAFETGKCYEVCVQNGPEAPQCQESCIESSCANADLTPTISVIPKEEGKLEAELKEVPPAATPEQATATPGPESEKKLVDQQSVQVLGMCTTILECLKNLDIQFVRGVFEKR